MMSPSKDRFDEVVNGAFAEIGQGPSSRPGMEASTRWGPLVYARSCGGSRVLGVRRA